MNRSALLKMIHAGARRLGWSNDETTYRAWMEKHTGKRSCRDCTNADLSLLVDDLRDSGALEPSPLAPLPTNDSHDRPTQHQWRYALDLSKKLGMSGAIHDPALAAFCKRVAKVDSLRFLDREGMRALITGLENWFRFRQQKRKSSQNP